MAAEVRKLAERSIRSTEEIRAIITSVQDETNATIMATEQGIRRAREMGQLMRSTSEVLEESLRATEQQREAADQVSSAMVEIRTAAEQLAAEQEQRTGTAERVDAPSCIASVTSSPARDALSIRIGRSGRSRAMSRTARMPPPFRHHHIQHADVRALADGQLGGGAGVGCLRADDHVRVFERSSDCKASDRAVIRD